MITKKKETKGNGVARHSAAYVTRHSYNSVTSQQRQPFRWCGYVEGDNDGGNDGEGDREGNDTSSSVTDQRNTNPIGVGDKDGVAC